MTPAAHVLSLRRPDHQENAIVKAPRSVIIQGYLSLPIMLSAGILAACSSGRSGTAARFYDLEERLLRAEPLRLRYTITAEGAFAASLSGTLHLAEGSQADLSATGTFGGAPVRLHLRSDGRRMDGGSEERTFAAEASPHLREALIIGLTRMGLLHNLARLTAGAPPDHAAGGVQEWVQVGEVSGGDERAAEQPEQMELRFLIFVSGERSAEATLGIDRRSGLPARREQVVDFPTGTMRVVEEYEFLP